MESVQLKPHFYLDDKWNVLREIPPKIVGAAAKPKFKLKKTALDDEEKIRDMIRAVRIEVAEKAETSKIKSEEKNDYLKSEIGMNIILPKGNIEELRFIVNLKSDGAPVDGLNAIDGFPKDRIEETHIVKGKIKVAVNKSFKFIPLIGDTVGEIVDVELEPWEFKLGSLKRVDIDFSGGLTAKPEWYFKKDGIKNDLRVALTIQKSKGIKKIDADVQASWVYDPGFLRKEKVGTDTKTIEVYNE